MAADGALTTVTRGSVTAHAPAASTAAQREPAVTRITRPGRWPTLALAELWRSRSICLVLAKRSLKARYRQTLLGAAWTLVQPVLLMVAFTVFFATLAGTPTQGIPHALFYLLGLLPWQIVSRVLNEGSLSIVNNAGLLTRVYFPRAYLPAAAALSAVVDLAFGLVALAAVVAFFGIVPGPAIIVLPVLVLVGLAAALGVALWLSALNASFRDVAQLMPLMTQLWFFGSPIIYPSEIVPAAFRDWYYLNPIALVIDGFRYAVAGTPAPTAAAWLIGTTVAFGLLVSGYVFFRKREPSFADVV